MADSSFCKLFLVACRPPTYLLDICGLGIKFNDSLVKEISIFGHLKLICLRLYLILKI